MADDEGGARLLGAMAKNPISAINLAAMIVLGSFVWFQSRADLDRLAERAARADAAVAQLSGRVERVEQETTTKLDAVKADIADIKATLRGVQTSLEFIVRQSGADRKP